MSKLSATLIDDAEKFVRNIIKLPSILIKEDDIVQLARQHGKSDYDLKTRYNLCQEYSQIVQRELKAKGWIFNFFKTTGKDHMMLGFHRLKISQEVKAFLVLDPTWKQFLHYQHPDNIGLQTFLKDLPEILFGWQKDIANFYVKIHEHFSLAMTDPGYYNPWDSITEHNLAVVKRQQTPGVSTVVENLLRAEPETPSEGHTEGCDQ